MISLWWSFTLTTIGVVGLALVYRHPRSIIGPSIGVAVQALWVAYSIASGQWWFLLSALTYGTVNAYGIRQRRRGQTPRPPEPPLRFRLIKAIDGAIDAIDRAR